MAKHLKTGESLQPGVDYILNDGTIGTYDMYTDGFDFINADGNEDWDHRIDTWYIGYMHEKPVIHFLEGT